MNFTINSWFPLVLYGSAMAYVIGPYLGTPWDADTLVAAVSTLPPSAVVACKASLAFPFTFHTFNGIRHLVIQRYDLKYILLRNLLGI